MRNGWILSAVVMFGLAVPAWAATLTVDLNGGADYTAIQPAIDAAANGDTVLVKPGEYVITEPINFNRLHNPDDPASPPVKNITVKSEGGAEVTTVKMSETPGDPDRASVVIIENGEAISSVLDSFSVTGGMGTKKRGGGILCINGSSPLLKDCIIFQNSVDIPGDLFIVALGGGVYCSDGSCPTMTNCTILRNWASGGGGGVYCEPSSSPNLTNCTISENWASCDGGGVYCKPSSSPTLTNCTISGNSTPQDMVDGHCGGGVYCYGATPTLTNCAISGNSTNAGGGVYCNNASPTLTDCAISGNSARFGGGGGVCCESSSAPTMTNCSISGNSPAPSGSGVYCFDSSPTLTNCRIAGNSSGYGGGGGVCCDGDSSPTLTNCTIADNGAADCQYGGGVYCGVGSSPVLTNCTISGNCARGGGGLFCYGTTFGAASSTLTNCIVWGNVGSSLLADGNAQLNVSFSCIETDSVWPGEGNTNTDPQFCGWGEKTEVWVDPSKPGTGDGSQGNPFSNARIATMFSFALSATSSCWGTGKGGCDMGADNGRCDLPGGTSRTVHLAAGTYKAEDLDLFHRVRLQGSGEDRTTIEGTVGRLCTGSSLWNLTITKGTRRGLLIVAGQSPEIANCAIVGNANGGVNCDQGSSPTFINCAISRNSEYSAVRCEYSCPTLVNCTISGNWAREWSSGVVCYMGSSPTLTNCTITGNSVQLGSGDPVYCSDDACLPVLTNCIVWANTPGSVCGNLSHCLTEQDPLFVAPGHWDDGGTPSNLRDDTWIPGDYHLQPGSPCIDTGICDGAPAFDLDGNVRPIGNGCDMGAYEFGGIVPPAPVVASVEPAEGPEHGRTPVTIRGANFAAWASVLFGGASAEAVVVVSASEITCKTPRHIAGLVKVEVINLNGQRGSLDGAFTFLVLPDFRRGDSNADNGVDIGDAITILGYLFGAAGDPSKAKVAQCRDAADANDDGNVDIADAIKILGHLFAQAGPLPGPFGECGIDPTIDALDCQQFTPCN